MASTCTRCGALVAPSLTLTPVCTDCGGFAPLYCRPVYASDERARAVAERRREVTVERIAQADSYLHDVALPGYLEVVGALQRMLLSVDTAGCREVSPEALNEAQGVLAQLRGRL